MVNCQLQGWPTSYKVRTSARCDVRRARALYGTAGTESAVSVDAIAAAGTYNTCETVSVSVLPLSTQCRSRSLGIQPLYFPEYRSR